MQEGKSEGQNEGKSEEKRPPRERHQSDTAGSATVKSADRVMDLLELLSGEGAGMTHAELASALQIPKSSLTEILRRMVLRGFLAYREASKTYAIGVRLGQLAHATAQTDDLVGAGRQVLEDLTAATGESSGMNLLKGDTTLIAAVVNGKQRLVLHMQAGETAPLYATSHGKAFLAFFPDEMREEYLRTVVLQRITPHTIRSVSKLRKELDRVRLEGVAYSFEEYTPGIVGIASPVFDETGYPLAAINVAMPAVRYGDLARKRSLKGLASAVNKLVARVQGIRAHP